MFRRITLFSLLLLCICTFANAQSWAVRGNLLEYGQGSAGAGIEARLGSYASISMDAYYNPWEFSKKAKVKHFMVQPEIKWWTSIPFAGSFLGLYAQLVEFNVGGIGLVGLNEGRVEGYMYGGGISYGYQWVLGNRLNIEANVGIGYSKIMYSKYRCERCGDYIGEGDFNFIGPAKLGVTIVYLL